MFVRKWIDLTAIDARAGKKTYLGVTLRKLCKHVGKHLLLLIVVGLDLVLANGHLIQGRLVFRFNFQHLRRSRGKIVFYRSNNTRAHHPRATYSGEILQRSVQVAQCQIGHSPPVQRLHVFAVHLEGFDALWRRERERKKPHGKTHYRPARE